MRPSTFIRYITHCAVFMTLAGYSVLKSQPALTVSEPSVDIGTVYNGAKKNLNFEIRNTGTETLAISDVYVPCGCTTVKRPASVLKPGERTGIEVTLNTTGMRGRISRDFTLTTNDPKAKNFTITIFADVRTEFESVDKSSVAWFGTVPTGKTARRTVVFRNVAGRPIRVRGAESGAGYITPHVPSRSVAPDDTISVEVDITPKNDGYITVDMYLLTNSPYQPKVPLRLAFMGVS